MQLKIKTIILSVQHIRGCGWGFTDQRIMGKKYRIEKSGPKKIQNRE